MTPNGHKALVLRYIPVDELAPYARNAREHPAKQIQNLAGLIARFGFRAPILIDGGKEIIAGEGRLLAATP